MRSYHSHDRSLPYARAAIPAALALIVAMAVIAAAQAPPVHSAPNSPAQGTSHKSQTGHSEKPEAKPISEGDLEHRFQGKALYLRGGYIDNDLRFDMHGALVSGSPQVSFTLGVVQVDKVHVSKHRVEIQGIRYGIHFLGAGPGDEDPTAYDKVRITPKK